MGDLILAIDNGTQSLKAMVFDGAGALLAKVQIPFEPYTSPQPGWAEQDPELFWNALATACRRLWDQAPKLKSRLAGVALTTQRATVINVDRKGRPLRPAIIWLDQRKTYNTKPLKGGWGALFKVAGLSGTIAYLQAEAEANWIRTYQPDVWKNTHKYLLLSGYLTHRLTGRYVDSIGCQVGYIPFSYRRLRWSSPRDWKWKLLPVRREQLPDLVPPGEPLGTISSAASAETGIPRGLPLIAAAADRATEVLGCGCFRPDTACLGYGTTATINVTQAKYIEPTPLLPAYPAAIPRHYTMEVLVYRGYWMVNWFKEEFGHPEQVRAAAENGSTEALFENFLTTTPPGAMGLLLQPYWTPGLKNPGPEAKGGVIGFGDVHTRAHLYRAILEGIAYALREGLERIQQRSGTAVTTLRICGGGSQSDGAMQLTADLFGKPAARPHVYETSGLGAAVVAAVGLQLHNDIPGAVAAMTHVQQVFEPDHAAHQLYDAIYRDVYLKMYKRLKPLYQRLREITGYPR